MKFHLIIWGSLIVFSSLVFDCTNFQATPSPSSDLQKPVAMNIYDPNQSVSSDDSVSQNPAVVIPQKAMIIEGTIEQVM